MPTTFDTRLAKLEKYAPAVANIDRLNPFPMVQAFVDDNGGRLDNESYANAMGRMTKAARDTQEGKQVEIFGQQVTRIEYRGHQVVTFAMIDKLHGRPDGTASDRFVKNKERFAHGEVFHLIKKAQNHKINGFGITVPNRGLTLITRRGYLKIVKSLNEAGYLRQDDRCLTARP